MNVHHSYLLSYDTNHIKVYLDHFSTIIHNYNGFEKSLG